MEQEVPAAHRGRTQNSMPVQLFTAYIHLANHRKLWDCKARGLRYLDHFGKMLC